MRLKRIAGLVSLSWGDRSSCGAQIGFETHLVGDPKDLLLCIEQLEEFTKILEGSHEDWFCCLSVDGSNGHALLLSSIKYGFRR